MCCLTTDAAKTLIHPLISSRLDCCNSLLVGVADCVIRKLQGVQNAEARMITGTRKFNHVTPILRDLHWLPVAQRYNTRSRCWSTNVPVSRSLNSAGRSFISLDVDTCGRPIPGNSTCNGQPQPNFAVSGPETWNSLPAELRISTLFTATFARRLKAHLFVSTINDMCLQRV